MIEQIVIEDMPEILALQKLAYQSEAVLYPNEILPPLTQTLEELCGDFTGQVFLKAQEDGHIVGSVRAFLRDGTCFIGRLIVCPERQKRGIGTQLMQKIEKRFSEAARFELFTGQKSWHNLRFYEKLGYRIFKSEPITESLTFLFLEKINDPNSGRGV